MKFSKTAAIMGVISWSLMHVIKKIKIKKIDFIFHAIWNNLIFVACYIILFAACNSSSTRWEESKMSKDITNQNILPKLNTMQEIPLIVW